MVPKALSKVVQKPFSNKDLQLMPIEMNKQKMIASVLKFPLWSLLSGFPGITQGLLLKGYRSGTPSLVIISKIRWLV
jgi:hypothetical protein